TDAVNKAQLDAVAAAVAAGTDQHYFVANGLADGSDDAVAVGDGAMAAGVGAMADGAGSSATGQLSRVVGENSVVVGAHGSVFGMASSGLGSNVVVQADNAVAL